MSLPKNPEPSDHEAVRAYGRELQDQIVAGLEKRETGGMTFREDAWTREAGPLTAEATNGTGQAAEASRKGLRGGGVARVLEGGEVFEKAGVNFSDVAGETLPPSASASRPELAGRSFRATGVSLVIHPRNPHVPTAHANVRFFVAEKPGAEPIWWFGGGFDLTPFYPQQEDVLHWHSTARAACEPFGEDLYPTFKAWCDRYFYLQHRDETRGVGGLFFDDHTADGDFEKAFAFMRSVGDHFLPAYEPIIERRYRTPFTEEQRQFQLYRRGRYVEFNLVYDRGTLFGLQSGGHTEAILMSMPPLARWDYAWHPEPGSAEARLYEHYLQPQDWLGAAP